MHKEEQASVKKLVELVNTASGTKKMLVTYLLSYSKSKAIFGSNGGDFIRGHTRIFQPINKSTSGYVQLRHKEEYTSLKKFQNRLTEQVFWIFLINRLKNYESDLVW